MFQTHLVNKNFSLLSVLLSTTVAPFAASKCSRYGNSMVLPIPGIPVQSIALSADTDQIFKQHVAGVSSVRSCFARQAVWNWHAEVLHLSYLRSLL